MANDAEGLCIIRVHCVKLARHYHIPFLIKIATKIEQSSLHLVAVAVVLLSAKTTGA
jgi:hypothetical protein